MGRLESGELLGGLLKDFLEFSSELDQQILGSGDTCAGIAVVEAGEWMEAGVAINAERLRLRNLGRVGHWRRGNLWGVCEFCGSGQH